MTWVLSIVVTTALLLVAPSAAEACFCSRGPCGAVATAPVLFEATIVSTEPDPGEGRGTRILRLADVRAIRGPAPHVIELEGSSCDLELAVGQRYFIEAHEWAPGKFGVSQCSLTRPANRASGFREFLRAPSAEQRPRVWGAVTSVAVGHRAFQFRGGGPPVEGAVVVLRGSLQRTTTTSATGEFRFNDVPDGDYELQVELPAGRTDISIPEAQRVSLAGGDACVDVDLVARSTARVTGVLVDERGRPVADAQVDLYTPPYNPFRRDFEQFTAGSDGAGRFVFEAVPSGVYQGGVGVPRPGEYRPFAPALALVDGHPDIRVEPGATVTVAPIVARRVEPVAVRGQVTAAPDVPLAGVAIVVSTPDAGDTGGWRATETDAAGRFTAELYRGVRYRVWARAGSRWAAPIEIVAGDAPIVLTLTPPK
jgi:hypothetical protein